MQHEREDGRKRQTVLLFMPGPDFGHVAQQPQGHGGVHRGLVFEKQVEKQGTRARGHAEQQVRMRLLEGAAHKGGREKLKLVPVHGGDNLGWQVLAEKRPCVWNL